MATFTFEPTTTAIQYIVIKTADVVEHQIKVQQWLNDKKIEPSKIISIEDTTDGDGRLITSIFWDTGATV